MSKPINLYIAPHIVPSEQEWSLLYPTPTVLFSEIYKNRTHKPEELGYTSCPAVRTKLKKILTFSNALECSYEYDFEKNNKEFKNITDSYFGIHKIRDNGFANLPTVFFSIGWVIFSDEPLEINFTPPYFDKPRYTNYGSSVPGSYDVGKWFRTYNLEVQLWNPSGEIRFEEGEPLFYAELMTDRQVNVHRFGHTEELEKIALSCVESTKVFGIGKGLLSRYKRFKAAGLREKILVEIKKNIVEENFLTL
jgi:hypothetical protein